MCFDPYILDRFAADDLINIHAKQLMLLILHPKPQGSDIAVGTAYADHIHWANILLHFAPCLSFFFIIVHSFELSKWEFLQLFPLFSFAIISLIRR